VETRDGKIPLGIPSLGRSIILTIFMKLILDTVVLAGAAPHVYF